MTSTSRFDALIARVQLFKAQMVFLGMGLSVAKENYLEMVGEGITNWSDFLAQPEIGLSVREANAYVKLSEFILEHELDIGKMNLAIAKFAATKGIDPADLMEDMNVLSLKDFKDRHYDVVQKEDNAEQTYDYMVMKRSKETGTLSRVYGMEKLEEKIKHKIDEQ